MVRQLAEAWRRYAAQRLKNPSYWTIQVLPEGSGRSRSYRLRRRTVYTVVSAFAAVAGVSAALVLSIAGRGHVMEELDRYRAENQELVSSLRAMEDRSERLSGALDELAVREQRFRVVAGLPMIDPDVYSVGVGGPGGQPGAGLYELAPDVAQAIGDVTLDMDQLLRRAELLETSLDEAADSMETRRDLFQRIPSIWPVIAEDSWLSSPFSYNRLHPLLGYRRPHPGVDISANLGSPVVAAGAGRVVYAGSKSGYGGFVEIDHGDGYVSRYAHLGNVRTRVGSQVVRGEVIGDVGRTGLTTGPNLHYEILRDDRPVNPYNYFLDDSYRR